MSEIRKYLDPKLVTFLTTTSRDEAIEELIDRLHSQGKLKDKEAFHKAILAREAVVSTGIGMGVAIPHAKLPEYDDFFIAIGVQRDEGIAWESLDGAPIKLIFMIGGPDNRQSDYLQILSRLTLALKSKERRKKALHVETAEELVDLFA